MSLHKSLVIKGKAGSGHRNVLKRFERIAVLKNKEEWDEQTVFNLPKLKSIKLKKKKSVVKQDDGAKTETK
jgi:small basic protein (TIGR04137 family)